MGRQDGRRVGRSRRAQRAGVLVQGVLLGAGVLGEGDERETVREGVRFWCRVSALDHESGGAGTWLSVYSCSPRAQHMAGTQIFAE